MEQQQIIGFVEKYLGEFKIKGKEVNVKICPFCQATEKDNQFKFYINSETGLFHCKRGSCGAAGPINVLSKLKTGKNLIKKTDFVQNKDRNAFMKEVEELVKSGIIPISVKTEEYLKNRGISKNTANYAWCKTEKGTDNLFIPIYDTSGNICNFKKRLIVPSGKLKSLNSKNGELRLIGMHLCIHEEKPLIIVEGEIDWLSILEVSRDYNVVSIPAGANTLSWVEDDAQFIDRFKSIIFWVDNDESGKILLQKLGKQFIDKELRFIESQLKDANDVLVKLGKDSLLDHLESSKELPIEGLIDISDVDKRDMSKIICHGSGIKSLDACLSGFRLGETTIWSGKNQSGKSTILGQVILSAINQGAKVFVYSGELTKQHFQQWIYLQANGKESVEILTRKFSDRTEAKVTDENHELISKWLKNKMYLYDTDDVAKESDLFKMMRVSYRKFGCRVFIIDNLLTVHFGEDEKDFYRRQSNFILKVKAFSKNQETHCHVVAHARKTSNTIIKKEDVSGSGDITNLVDNFLSVNRVYDDPEIQMILEVGKNRMYGDNETINLRFDRLTKRFYDPTNSIERDFEFPWRFLKKDLAPWDY